MNFCGICGTEIGKGMRFCGGCGNVVANNAAYAPQQPLQAGMTVDDKSCPSCGSTIKKAALICSVCGARQEGGTASGDSPLAIVALVLVVIGTVLTIANIFGLPWRVGIGGRFFFLVNQVFLGGGIILAGYSMLAKRTKMALIAIIIGGTLPVLVQLQWIIRSM